MTNTRFEDRLGEALERLDADRSPVALAVSSRPSRRRFVVAGGLAVGTLATFGGVAAATGLFSSSGTRPDVFIAGSEFSAKGAGCAASSPVAASLDGAALATTTADANGQYDVTAVLPPGTPLGVHHVAVTCTDPRGAVSRDMYPVNIVVPTPTAPSIGTNSQTPVGGSLLFKVSGFPASAPVVVSADGIEITTVTADANGSADGAVVVPSDLAVGVHTLRAVAGAVDASTPFTLTAS